MAKVTLNDLTSLSNQTSAVNNINGNMQSIEDELNNNVLYRNPPVGEPNSMSVDLDMNNNDLLNVNSGQFTTLTVNGITVDQQAANAAASASAAATSASNAATSETNAATSASNAATSATLAEDARDIAITAKSPYFDTVADMVADTALEIGMRVRTLGYNSLGDGGGNEYSIVAAGTGTADGGSYIDLTGSGLQAKGLFVDGKVTTKRFGAQDSTDITTAITNAINYSKSNGYKPVLIDNTSPSITSALPQLNSSFNHVALRGLSKTATTLDISAAGDDVFNWFGGSGGEAGVGIEDMEILGSATQEPFYNRGFGGLRVRNCEIKCKTAMKLENVVTTAPFTEFVVFDACSLKVDHVFKLKRGSGNESFHGCGWTNGSIINQQATATGPLIVVGDSGDTGRCVLYNVPLNGSVFMRVTQDVFGSGNAQTHLVSTYGELVFELLGGTPTVSSISNHVHAGSLLSWNTPLDVGTIVLSNLSASTASGNFTGVKGAVTKTYVTDGVQTSVVLDIIQDFGTGGLAWIDYSAANHEFLDLRAFAGRISGSISPSSTQIVRMRNFDGAALGGPTYTMGDTTLTVSNANWSGVTMTIRVTVMPQLIRRSPVIDP